MAVLVVATPCPLLLAAPIAIMSGLSRAARSGVVVKGGEALERLAAGRVLLLDKTGTVTRGEPVGVDIVTAGTTFTANQLSGWAAGLGQVSPHVLAGAIVKAARARGLTLAMPQVESELLPHEHHEEHELFPVMDKLFGGPDATAALSRTHAEIDLQVMRLHRVLAGVDDDTINAAELPALRQILYGLYGVLRLHNAQEEESLFSLLPEDDATSVDGTAKGGP